MSDFKKGDRVRYTGAYVGWNNPQKIGWTGVVSSTDHGQVYVHWDGETGAGSGVYAENLEAVVSYTPQVGDKVRVVHEGVVSDVDGKYFSLEGDGDFEYFPGGGMVVELIEKAPEPPKPFPAETYVTSPSRSLLPMARTADGKWINVRAGVETIYSDESIRGYIAKGRLVVSYEPPTS